MKNAPSLGLFTVWLVPYEERVTTNSKSFNTMSMEERIAHNRKHSEQTWYERDVVCHDPILVQVVEELGEKANGNYADLRIAEVDGLYRIDEYDGAEGVETPGSYVWQNANDFTF